MLCLTVSAETRWLAATVAGKVNQRNQHHTDVDNLDIGDVLVLMALIGWEL
jgi:hypothetical protein